MFELTINKEFERKHSGEKVVITDVRGEHNQFIGYRGDEEGVRWLTDAEFQRDFIPLSPLSLEERVHILGNAIARINTIVHNGNDPVIHLVREVVEKCVEDLKTNV